MDVRTQLGDAVLTANGITDLFTPCAKLMQGKSPEEIIALMADPLFRQAAKVYEKKRQRREAKYPKH